MIEVHLHTILQPITEAGVMRKVNLELPPGTTLAVILDILNIKFPADGLILIINGRVAGLTDVLSDGDIVHIIPAISGG